MIVREGLKEFDDTLPAQMLSVVGLKLHVPVAAEVGQVVGQLPSDRLQLVSTLREHLHHYFRGAAHDAAVLVPL